VDTSPQPNTHGYLSLCHREIDRPVLVKATRPSLRRRPCSIRSGVRFSSSPFQASFRQIGTRSSATRERQRTEAPDPTKPSSVLPEINELQASIRGHIWSSNDPVPSLWHPPFHPIARDRLLTPVLLECPTKQSIRLEAKIYRSAPHRPCDRSAVTESKLVFRAGIEDGVPVLLTS
jgi:hypothetical protein